MDAWQFWGLFIGLGAVVLAVRQATTTLGKRLDALYVVTAQVLAEIHKGNRERRQEWRDSLPDQPMPEED